MFKKVITTWAKGMDKQRVKENEKSKKSDYYINLCVKHYEIINEAVSKCESVILSEDNLISEATLPTDAVQTTEVGLGMIEQCMKFIRENKTPYDLPPNAKHAYRDSTQALLDGLQHLETCWKTQLLYYHSIALFSINEISELEFNEMQETVSNLPSFSESMEEYIYHRKLSASRYETALQIIKRYL